MLTRALLILVFSQLGVALALAQVATVPAQMEKPFPNGQLHAELEKLTTAYQGGQWTTLQELARKAIGEARRAATADATKQALDVTKNHVALMWIGSDPFGKPILMRVIVHDPMPELFVADLPGLHEGSDDGALVELLLARTELGGATSVYASTPERNPALDLLPAFIQAIAGRLFDTIGAIAPVRPPGVARAPNTLYATVRRVGLPFKRASVRVKILARDPFFESESFKSAVPQLAARLQFDEGSASLCGRALARRLKDELPGSIDPACTEQPPRIASCRDKFDAAIARAYEDERATCVPNVPSELAGITMVNQRFREFVNASLTKTTETEVAFRNRPPTRIAYGAGTGVLMAPKLSQPRVKLANGVLAADPLPRVATMAFVNWRPEGYDPETPKVSDRERWRLMFGAALTPDFGIIGGGNVLLARGIGLTVGYGVLFAKGAMDEEVGKPPADDADAFRLSTVGTWFVGISYNYK